MLKHINIKIEEVEKKLIKRQKAYNILKKQKQELKREQIRGKKLSNILKKKERKIKKLQSPSIICSILSIFKKENKNLEEYLQEYNIIKSKYEDYRNSISKIKKDINFYKEQISSYHSLDADYDDLIREKKDLILKQNDSVARELANYLDEILEKELNISRVKESISTCNRVILSLEKSIRSLESARGWGKVDILGGGFLVTAAKHSKIIRSREEIKNLQREIKALKASLYYVDLPSNIDLEIGAFATFADYFLDGLVADLFVQSKIKDSLNKLKDAYNRVNNIKNALQTRLGDLNKELRNLKDKEKLLVEGYR